MQAREEMDALVGRKEGRIAMMRVQRMSVGRRTRFNVILSDNLGGSLAVKEGRHIVAYIRSWGAPGFRRGA